MRTWQPQNRGPQPHRRCRCLPSAPTRCPQSPPLKRVWRQLQQWCGRGSRDPLRAGVNRVGISFPPTLALIRIVIPRPRPHPRIRHWAWPAQPSRRPLPCPASREQPFGLAVQPDRIDCTPPSPAAEASRNAPRNDARPTCPAPSSFLIYGTCIGFSALSGCSRTGRFD
jgi:hypothetical protein